MGMQLAARDSAITDRHYCYCVSIVLLDCNIVLSKINL